MLVDNAILAQALNDYDARNKLIAELDKTPLDDPQVFYKLMLGAWLGSNITLYKFIKCEDYRSWGMGRMQYFRPICYCLIILDKYISVYTEGSEAKKILSACREDMLASFNNHYELLRGNPTKLYEMMRDCITALPDKVVHETKKRCLNQLARLYKPKQDNTRANKEVYAVLNDGICHPRVKVFSQVNAAGKRYAFYVSEDLDPCSPDYEMQKLLLPAEDGIILDGLSIRKKSDADDKVVLSLDGRCPSERAHVADSAMQMAELFGARTVSINHRNYSIRSAKKAKNSKELANDVVAFAKYFHKQNKQIILYGMCGGAVEMIHAALILKEMNIPFKLIVDRFSHRYTDFYDMKTIHRATKLDRFECKVIEIPLHAVTYGLLGSALALTHSDNKFNKLLAKVPENDLLMLQGKPAKHENLRDLHVHPKNDLRYFFKKQRHEKKLLLKSLLEQSNQLSELFPANDPLHGVFSKLRDFFKASRSLIDDEKLSTDEKPDKILDVHNVKLYDMVTRHRDVSVAKFVQGFFAKRPEGARDFSCLEACLEDEILVRAKVRYAEQPQMQPKLNQLAAGLAAFLQVTAANKAYLNRMTAHAAGSGLIDISTELATLQASPLLDTAELIKYYCKSRG